MARHLKLPHLALGLTFIDDPAIARLNLKFMKKKGATDVLSFPLDSKELLGDIVVSLDTAKKQAKTFCISLKERVMFLVVHGFLHLLGYDHQTERDWKIMSKKERELMKLVG
ncbi:MAG: rRNA maturation RNase YbeY [Deltaproteobacteria bacterium GWA2_45_12]|nr:MAG: rRNA maturation RNase YbeY [Deltaproteobacteria bacterium GWA2_45_12]